MARSAFSVKPTEAPAVKRMTDKTREKLADFARNFVQLTTKAEKLLQDASEYKASIKELVVGHVEVDGKTRKVVVHNDVDGANYECAVTHATSTHINAELFLQSLSASVRSKIMSEVLDPAKLQEAIDTGLIKPSQVDKFTSKAVTDRVSIKKIAEKKG